MIGSVTASKRAAAFAQALDEHELDEAAAVDRTAEGTGRGTAPTDSVPVAAVPSPVRPSTGGGSGTTAEATADATADAPADVTPDAPPAHPAAAPSAERAAPEPALLLGLAERLRDVPRPTVAPDVKTVQRAQLVAAMEAEFASPEARARQVPAQRDGRGSRKGAHRAPTVGPLSRLRPNSRWSRGIAAGGLGVGVAASALGGVASASNDALPGDSLYGLKRGMEDLRLDFAEDATDRGRVHLDRASARLREARRLTERTKGGAPMDEESVSKVHRALAGMRYDAAEGHRLLSSAYERDGSIAPMRSLSSFSSGHRESWSKLREHLPAELSDVRDEVSFVFDSMDSDITPVAGLISGQDGRRARERGAGAEGRRGDGHTSPRPSSSSGSAGTGAQEGASGEPAPSGSVPESSELIGGSGLLDPSGDGRGDPSHSGPDGRGSSHQEPEVTLPPIIPDVLPGLKKLSKDDK